MRASKKAIKRAGNRAGNRAGKGPHTRSKEVKDILSTSADPTAPSNGNGTLHSLFSYWNSLGIIQHRRIERYQSHLSAALKTYSAEEISEAMKNYKDILESPEHWPSYRWGLDNFLSRGLEKFLPVNNPFDNYRGRPKQ